MANRRAHNNFAKVHTMGDRGFRAVSAQYQDKRLQGIKRETDGYVECPRCKRMYKDPSKQHFSDYKNKIRCMEPIR